MSVPITIVGGYLGAGKTTLINRLLNAHDVRGLAVMVNDFGAVNIDAELLRESADGRIMSFANGCVCCSIGDDFAAGLDTLRQQPEAIDRVIVEASGVATPANLKRQCQAPGFHSHGCLVVVNADNYALRSENKYVGKLLLQQVREADWLYVNRNQADASIGTDKRNLENKTLMSLIWPAADAADDAAETASPPEFSSISANQHLPVEKRTLNHLLGRLPDWVERVKGFVETPEQILLVQQAAGRFEITPQQTTPAPALVFIVPAAKAASLRRLLQTEWRAWQLDTL